MSHAMALRIGFAVLSALFGMVWVNRSSSLPFFPRWTTRLRALVIGLCAFWSFVWLLLALIRARYPYELEWIGGAMRDHCARVLAGQQLYVPPGPGWFPYEYPPLYFWVCALAMKLTGGLSYMPMRAVSILSTLSSAGLLFAWTRKLVQSTGSTDASAPRFGTLWGGIAAGVFLATYRFTGAWYDAERLDMLFLFLSLLGVYLLECAETPTPPVAEGGASRRATAPALYAILSALAFGLAFLTKQQAVLFVLGGAGALFWRRSWRTLALFGLTVTGICLGTTILLNRATDGWFGYYCFHVPLSNGILLSGVEQYLLDLLLFAPLIVLLFCGAMADRRTRAGMSARRASGDDAILVAMTAMGVLGSWLSRAHWGGDQNVLIAGYVFIGTAACVYAGRWEQRQPQVGLPLYGLCLFQLIALVYQPMLQLPRAANYAAGARYASVVRDLEREGEVLCLDHGALTTPAHFQFMGLHDVLLTEKRMPVSIAAAFRAHRYVAIVADALPPPNGDLADLMHNYVPVQCLNMTTTWVVTGYPTPGPNRRVWILRPRNAP